MAPGLSPHAVASLCPETDLLDEELTDEEVVGAGSSLVCTYEEGAGRCTYPITVLGTAFSNNNDCPPPALIVGANVGDGANSGPDTNTPFIGPFTFTTTTTFDPTVRPDPFPSLSLTPDTGSATPEAASATPGTGLATWTTVHDGASVVIIDFSSSASSVSSSRSPPIITTNSPPPFQTRASRSSPSPALLIGTILGAMALITALAIAITLCRRYTKQRGRGRGSDVAFTESPSLSRDRSRSARTGKMRSLNAYDGHADALSWTTVDAARSSTAYTYMDSYARSVDVDVNATPGNSYSNPQSEIPPSYLDARSPEGSLWLHPYAAVQGIQISMGPSADVSKVGLNLQGPEYFGYGVGVGWPAEKAGSLPQPQ
ncbi:hypothetical protein MKEN_01306300 [Mycena kentingensis (nom. inval.)]|nr:hypothetical protein MKEN_01306300 [Mycena kentingensis (nom. inval.)]